MKKIYLLILSSLFIMNTINAQENRREEIETFRKEFFTRQLKLTGEEAKKFWPIYNEEQIEMQKLQRERRGRMKSARGNFDSMSDAEIEKMINEELANRRKELDIEMKYHERYKAVLPIKKLAIYYRAQEGFKRELIRKLKDGEGPRGPRPGED